MKLGLIGHPVAHSLSPALHAASLKFAGIEGDYSLVDCTGPELESTLQRLVAEGYGGLNVTAPHKQAVMRYLSELTDQARRVAAVNTIKIEGGRLIGHNTDLGGLAAAIREAGMIEAATGTAAVFGAGGAARAACWALNELGCRSMFLVARRIEAARTLAGEVVNLDGWRAGLSVCAIADAGSTPVSFFVNCTPVGLTSNAVPEWMLSWFERGTGHAAVLDMVYQAGGPTVICAEACRLGLSCQDGRLMLLHQAALAFRFWTGKDVPVQIMRHALQQER